jgi:hypothetical protein
MHLYMHEMQYAVGEKYVHSGSFLAQHMFELLDLSTGQFQSLHGSVVYEDDRLTFVLKYFSTSSP